MIKVFIYLLALMPGAGFSQQNNAVMPGDTLAKTLVSKMEVYAANHSVEKAYLQFDKPYYAIGDTIYFKAYVTLTEKHLLSNLSGVLHVDLINSEQKVEHSLILRINNGLGWGDFNLSDTLKTGSYQIRAYTNWMLNDKIPAVFLKEIPIISAQTHINNKQTTFLAPKIDLQFFPEGGHLVYGLMSKVAFKAVGSNGESEPVEGEIVDDDNNIICLLKSSHNGMGYINFKPQNGKKYHARILTNGSSHETFPIPPAVEAGVVISINNESLPVASINIKASENYYTKNREKDMLLLIYSGGIATTVKLKLDTDNINLEIIKRHLKTGVATITLFTGEGEPLCERLIFIQNYDRLNLSLSEERGKYSVQDSVNINLDAKNRADSAVSGHFSVSVIYRGLLAINDENEDNILTTLLLTSDLKGVVEQPAYYFANDNQKTRSDLDLVMLTNGYRRFEWKAFMDDKSSTFQFKPEKALSIAGIVKTHGGKPIGNAKVSLLSFGKSTQILTTMTGQMGDFQFANLAYNDSTKFILQSTDSRGSNNVVLHYNPTECFGPLPSNDKPVRILDTINALQEKVRQELMGKYPPDILNGKILKEVKIRAKKIIPVVTESRYGVPEQIIDGATIEYGGMLADKIIGKLRGITFDGNSRSEAIAYTNKAKALHLGPMLIVLDGIEMPKGFDINSINTGSIDKIEVMTDATVDWGGVMIINTVKGKRAGGVSPDGMLTIFAKGFYKAREFYQPKYENKRSELRPYLASTLFWRPEITTDNKGKASFKFKANGPAGNYRIVIEGIGNKGELGHFEYNYKVE